MNLAASRLKLPAAAVIAVAVVNVVASLLVFVVTLLNAERMDERNFGSDAERLGYLASFVLQILIATATVIAAPFIVFGAIHMLAMSNHRMAKAAAILTLIPLTSCCCVLGVPVGIWALTVLRDPLVKQAFDERAAGTQASPSTPVSPGPPV